MSFTETDIFLFLNFTYITYPGLDEGFQFSHLTTKPNNYFLT